MSWYLRTNDFKQSPFEGDVHECTKREILKLGLSRLGLFWLLAAVSILIPVLHFFLVPAFFITGIFMALRQFKTEQVAENGVFLCPKCSEKNSLKKFHFNEQTRIRCQSCGEQLGMKFF